MVPTPAILPAKPAHVPVFRQFLAAQLVDQDQVDVLTGAVTVPECQAIQSYAAKVHVVYMPLDGCGGDDLTARTCDKYTFRVYNGGTAALEAMVTQASQTYGKRWGDQLRRLRNRSIRICPDSSHAAAPRR
jgi:ABC-type branched-subunit amino acid transport system substrate-binding protein